MTNAKGILVAFTLAILAGCATAPAATDTESIRFYVSGMA